MIEKFTLDYTKLKKYSKIYLLITSTLFLIIPIKILPKAVNRFEMLIVVFLCYVVLYFFVEMYLLNHKSSNKCYLTNSKNLIRFQLNLFLFFLLAGFIINLILALSNSTNITLYLLFTNIILGLLICILKNKRKYLQ